MLPLVLGVIAASVVGSLHCAGMCGPFLAFALGLNEPGVSKARAQAAYHTGRLLTYSCLGAAAGLLGRAVDLSGEAVGLERIAATLAALTMIVFGTAAIARSMGHRLPAIRAPRVVERWFRRGCDLAMRVPPVHRAALVGMLTTLLPCGWLYSFALVAAGTAHPASGAVVMAAFWLGTLPVMVGLGAGIQSLAGPLRRAVPALMGVVIVALGLTALVHRSSISLAGLEPVAGAAVTMRQSPDHLDAASGATPSAAQDSLDAVGARPLPCCTPEGDE